MTMNLERFRQLMRDPNYPETHPQQAWYFDMADKMMKPVMDHMFNGLHTHPWHAQQFPLPKDFLDQAQFIDGDPKSKLPYLAAHSGPGHLGAWKLAAIFEPEDLASMDFWQYVYANQLMIDRGILEKLTFKLRSSVAGLVGKESFFAAALDPTGRVKKLKEPLYYPRDRIPSGVILI